MSSDAVELAFKRYDAKEEGEGGQKTPVIFIHGMTASKENWGNLPEITAQKTGRTVYAVDLRNHGDSPWSEEWNFDVSTQDVLKFLDDQDIPRAILVGHSMGGVTAYMTALKAPERVESFLTEDISVKPPDESIMKVIVLYLRLTQEAMKTLPKGLPMAEAKSLIFKHVLENLPPEIKELAPPQSQDEVLDMKLDEEGRWSLKANMEVLQRGCENPASLRSAYEGSYEGPSTLVFGKLSPFMCADDESLLKKHFPNIKLVCVDGATHTVHSDCPKEFREALFHFLQE